MCSMFLLAISVLLPQFHAKLRLKHLWGKEKKKNSKYDLQMVLYPVKSAPLSRARQIYKESKLRLHTSAQDTSFTGRSSVSLSFSRTEYYWNLVITVILVSGECRILNAEMLEVHGVLAESFALLGDSLVVRSYFDCSSKCCLIPLRRVFLFIEVTCSLGFPCNTCLECN